MEAIERKVDDDKINDLNDIIESQAMIDEVLVKNLDDIALMKKMKEENSDALKLLELKFEILDKEIVKRGTEPNNSNEVNEKHIKKKENDKTVRKYYNRGYCKHKSWCWNFHAEDVCKIYLQDGKCFEKNCISKVDVNCAYLHKKEMQSGNDDDECPIEYDTLIEIYVQENNDNIRVDTELVECAHCKSDEVKNQCDKCAKYFCEKFEFTLSDMGVQGLNDESILDLYKSYQFTRYTCNTVHKGI